MASKEFNVIAILYPKKGKTDEVYNLYLHSRAYQLLILTRFLAL